MALGPVISRGVGCIAKGGLQTWVLHTRTAHSIHQRAPNHGCQEFLCFRVDVTFAHFGSIVLFMFCYEFKCSCPYVVSSTLLALMFVSVVLARLLTYGREMYFQCFSRDPRSPTARGSREKLKTSAILKHWIKGFSCHTYGGPHFRSGYVFGISTAAVAAVDTMGPKCSRSTHLPERTRRLLLVEGLRCTSYDRT